MSEQDIGGVAAEATEQAALDAGASTAAGAEAEISSEAELAALLADEAGEAVPGAKQQDETTDEETGAEADAKAKAEAAAEEERLNAEAAEKHPAFQKRIDQLVKQRAEAQEQLAAVRHDAETARAQLAAERARLEQLERERLDGAAAAQGVSKLYLAQSEQELDARRDELMGLVQWCRANAEGGRIGTQELEPEQVASTLAMVERELLVEMPQARKALEQRGVAAQYAAAQYPEYFGTAAQERGENVIRGLLAKAPGLARVEQLPLMVGDMLAGAALRRMGLRPDAKAERLLSAKDGKPAWSAETARDASARAIVADAVRERRKTEGAAARSNGLGGSATGAPARQAAGGGGDLEDRFVKNPSEETLASLLAG